MEVFPLPLAGEGQGEGEVLNRDKSKDLRRNQTNVETILWHKLRNRQLNGLKFRRQIPIEGYIVDFVCFEKKLIIELDGGQHNEDAAKVYDEKRTSCLKQNGYMVLRFWNNEVLANIEGVLFVIAGYNT